MISKPLSFCNLGCTCRCTRSDTPNTNFDTSNTGFDIWNKGFDIPSNGGTAPSNRLPLRQLASAHRPRRTTPHPEEHWQQNRTTRERLFIDWFRMQSASLEGWGRRIPQTSALDHELAPNLGDLTGYSGAFKASWEYASPRVNVG